MWQVRRVAETGSTNVDVAELARAGAPEGTVVVADHQSAGRGRLDRTWETPAGTSLAVSFLLRPADVPPARWPWLPLLAGVAAVEAVTELAELGAALKWPNDVLVGNRKLAGILVERVDTSSGPAAVVGVGLNVTQRADQLPTGATSLATEIGRARRRRHGTEPGRDDVLAALGDRLADWYAAWRGAGGDPVEGLAAAYRRRCSTFGRRVRVEVPSGESMDGLALDVDGFGRLVLETYDGIKTVGAGDIVHLRTRP